MSAADAERRSQGVIANEDTGESSDDQLLDEQKDEESDAGDQPDPANPPPPQEGLTDTVEKALPISSLTPRWRNWVIRGVFALMMVVGFFGLIWGGPFYLIIAVMTVQLKCFQEIISIGHKVYQSHDLPWFRTLQWYFLLCANYFFYGETITDYFGHFLQREEIFRPLIKYRRIAAFTMYVTGFCMFVLTLVKRHYLKQFTMFGWTHITLLIVVTQSHLIIQNIFEGLIWLIVPVSMVICNDVMAYIFGFFFGRTSLIKLSPKKTWEGFIGAFFSTLLFGWLLAYFMSGYEYFVCPVEFGGPDSYQTMMGCTPAPLFQLTDYTLPSWLQGILHVMGLQWKIVNIYPFQIHSIYLATFASLIGPFGGFFASGFKRAFKIKASTCRMYYDFADVIPGHGGMVDRFDCQYLMATFVHVYHHSFIRAPNPGKIVQQVLALRPDLQLVVFNKLKQHLLDAGLVENSCSS
uniref:Phosphatidate cytidylyltransferase n=1 Tax=Branchiostoma floridae TaxID=7739 RepID=C3ZRF3_BRAFL|eukprot:XP_002588881.1 hypothetical protein BRAFLDRAFT_284160 [Branchiostoma floridae]